MRAVVANKKDDNKGGGAGGPGQRRPRKSTVKNPASPPTTVDLHGVKIHFPFRPYECQEEYMKKVIEALLRKENALLESPTGTGKTLCLLCASLAWQRQVSRQLGEQQREQQNAAAASGGGTASNNADNNSADTNNTNKKPRVPTIIYASRTHSQLSQVVRELQSTRYRPTHAVLGSREQMCVNPKVKKPNAPAPAADINHDCSKLCKERKCRYRNNLGDDPSKFVPPPNEEAANGSQPVMDMEDLVKMGKSMNVCPFYYTRAMIGNAELVLMPYNYLFSKDARDTTLADIPWDDAVVIFDEAHNLESFASESASFDLSNSDVGGCIGEVDRAMNNLRNVVGSDSSNGQGSGGVKMDNLLRLKAIFLKLEEHIFNLPDRAAYAGEYMMDVFQRGASISHGNHELFLDEVRKVNDFLMDMRQGSSSSAGGGGRGTPHLEHFATCIKRVYGHQMESRCLARAAYYRVHVSPKPTATGAGNQNSYNNKNNNNRNSNNKNAKTAGRTISYWCFAPALAMEELAGLNVRSIIVTSGTLSPLPSYTMELGLKFPHTLENPHIIDDEQIIVRVVGKGVSGKVLSSSFERRKDGEYYAELGNTLVSLAKVTPAGMLVFFPSYGVMYACLERWGGPASNYSSTTGGGKGQQGGKNDFFAVRRRPAASASNNNKYSFPHAPTLFYDKNSPSTPWKRLLGTKSVVVEPKSSADLSDAISEFRRYLGLPRSSGCILMGVCRGKISEGIDFSHEQCRAVVITGLPFPPSFDPKVKMKREFLDQARVAVSTGVSGDGGFDSSANSNPVANKLSGNEWYTQQAHRAVNQAIGRVIRNSTDYGAVLLMDTRFDQSRNQEGLSKWLRPHIKKDEGVGATIRSLVQFFREADANVEVKKKAQIAAIELEYEPEDEETVTKFACVRATAENDTASGTNTTSYVAPEQVVARGDLKDTEEELRPRAEANHTAPAKRTVDYNSAFDTKPPATAAARSHATTSEAPRGKTFFTKAMQVFSVSEMNTVKKALVAMNNHAKNNDSRSYCQVAREIVSLLVHHKHFSLRGDRHEESLLLMLFQLLPVPHRKDVQLIAFQMVFDNSDFGSLCKEKLAAGYHGVARSCKVELLRSLWCVDSNDQKMKTSDYIAKVQEIFRLFFNLEGCLSPPILKAFLNLVPSRYAAPAQALAQEMMASLKMQRIKEAEKKSRGEASVKVENFKLPSWDARSKAGRPGTKVEPTKEVAEQLPAQTVLKAKKEAPGAVHAASVNPYARKRPAATSGAVAAAATGRTRKTSLSSLIKAVQSDTFVKRTPADLVEKLKIKAPKNLDCPICNTASKEPFVADCGHVACLPCWKDWFKRSQTCPTCRVATCTESLALVVSARDDSGRGGPSTKMPRLSKSEETTAASDCEDDDEELEIC